MLATSSLLVLTSCDLPYYWQAARGQLQLVTQRQSIVELIDAQTTPDVLKDQLKIIVAAREFALARLPLQDNRSYLNYVDLGREHVIWNLFVTPELSMENHTWCYPIAGCVSYRGYFSEANALQSAEEWQQQGFDVYVGGVDAYSTLGWFDDPVLSSFLKRSALGLAGLIFHELSHQVLYVKDDTLFNESFATTVEEILLQQWISENQLEQSWNDYQQFKERQKAFMEMVVANKKQREALYQSTISDSEKAEGKQLLITQLEQQYQQFKMDWDGFNGYDAWFAKGLNNAQLSTIATYYELVPGFHALYLQSNQNLPEFILHCKSLAELPEIERKRELEQLANSNIVYTEE